MDKLFNTLKPFVPSKLKVRIKNYLGVRRLSRKDMLHAIFDLLRQKLRYNYEPVSIGGKFYTSKREWKERWGLIKAELVSFEATSLLDIGCAEGWFLRRAAEDLGCFAFGVDVNGDRLLLGEVTRLHDNVERCAVMKAMLTSDDIKKLPMFDISLCLSVVHHIIRIDGVEAGCEFVKAICKITRKALIFEMGTSEEREMSWARDMPRMENGQGAFIRDFLADAGFHNIRELGKTLSIEKGADRILFCAEPKHA